MREKNTSYASSSRLMTDFEPRAVDDTQLLPRGTAIFLQCFTVIVKKKTSNRVQTRLFRGPIVQCSCQNAGGSVERSMYKNASG